MDTQEIARAILADNGITLDSSRNSRHFLDGYLVSRKGYEIRLSRNVLREGFKEAMTTIDSAISYLSTCAWPDAYLRAWIDGEHVYFDVSDWIEDRQEAIDLGKERDQIAIYDCATEDSIYLTHRPAVFQH